MPGNLLEKIDMGNFEISHSQHGKIGLVGKGHVIKLESPWFKSH